jgi:hypothetical protein
MQGQVTSTNLDALTIAIDQDKRSTTRDVDGFQSQEQCANGIHVSFHRKKIPNAPKLVIFSSCWKIDTWSICSIY